MTYKFGIPPSPAGEVTDVGGVQSTDASTGVVFPVTLNTTGTNTLENPTNLQEGQQYTWQLKQDAVTPVDVEFGDSFFFAGGTAPTITQTTSAVDILRATAMKDAGGNIKLYSKYEADSKAPPSIPSSITAGANLVHWYRMDEGSTSAVIDLGTNASSTDMTLVGASSETGGPTAIGTPDVIKFDGSTGLGIVNARAGGTNTPLGDLFNTNTFTVAWWMKDLTASYGASSENSWLACVGSGWSWSKGWGMYYYYYNFYPWQNHWNVGAYAGGWGGASSWRHHVIRYDPSASASGQWEHFINGTPSSGNASATLDTGIGTETNVYFTLGGVKTPSGGTSHHTAPYISDLRFYDIAITDANINSIYAGDWT